jgi:hypothetical protein
VRKRLGSRKAFVAVYMVFAMLVLIPMVGLAIDLTVLYNVKSRLQEACDAGAIGAGSLVQRSTDVTDPTTNATLRDAVQRFFNANLTPVPWRAVQTSYDSNITQDNPSKVRTIYVTASYTVPMLFMRVLGINNSQVSAQAIAKLRFVNMIVLVDRSGSVQRTGSGTLTNQQIIKSDLNQFVGDPATSVFVDGRDVIGMISYGADYYVDYSPQTHFQTSIPSFATATASMNFGNNSTNTGEGLYQAWYQLAQLAQPGALNVVVLITDGRPSAFTANFAVDPASHCVNRTFQGVITSTVNDGHPAQFPPPVGRPIIGIDTYAGTAAENDTLVTGSSGCAFAANSQNVTQDVTTIPNLIGPQDHTTGLLIPGTTTFLSTTGYYAGGSGATVAANIRYAASNYAYNVAQAIRQDAATAPVIYCIGLNFDTATYPNEEPLDADFLATLANDPTYRSAGKPTGVYQAGQTPGKYYDVTYSGLDAALQDIAGQILRLTAH